VAVAVVAAAAAVVAAAAAVVAAVEIAVAIGGTAGSQEYRPFVTSSS